MATKFDHKHPLAEKHDHANDESTNNQTDQEQDGEEVANRPQIHGSKKRFESQEHGEENLDFRWTWWSGFEWEEKGSFPESIVLSLSNFFGLKTKKLFK